MSKLRKNQRLYIVMRLQDEVLIDHLGNRLIRVRADNNGGICGYLPCFTNKRKAQRYAGKKYGVIAAEAVEP